MGSFDEHLNAPRGRGNLRGAPHAGAAGGTACGDLVRVAVRLDGAGRVAEAGFDASGCGAAIAAGSATVALVEGAPLLEAARTRPEDISAALGGLSPGKLHAATLAADALHRALGAAAHAQAGEGGGPPPPPDDRRTLIAMSGGVDSTVAALLALEAGHEVVGVTLELWSDPAGDGTKSCCSPQAVTGARGVAHSLGLPHLTLDLREQFRRHVVEDFIGGYAAGRTPNPCVRCNGLVRFDEMLALAGALGAARLATGHYARIARDPEGPLLQAAADDNKDQSYMLARLSPERLERLWFPLGELAKPQVRERARAAGLPAVAGRADSQDLCFLAGTRREELLRRHAGPARLAAAEHGGEIVDLSGRVLGRHRGQHRFTVGQRRGLGVATASPPGPSASSTEPLYVLHKDPATARITVGPRAALATSAVELAGARLERPAASVDRVKLRYRGAALPCRVRGEPQAGDRERLTVELREPAARAAPGQVAVLLSGELVVGHGTVAEPRAAPAAGALAADGGAHAAA